MNTKKLQDYRNRIAICILFQEKKFWREVPICIGVFLWRKIVFNVEWCEMFVAHPLHKKNKRFWPFGCFLLGRCSECTRRFFTRLCTSVGNRRREKPYSLTQRPLLITHIAPVCVCAWVFIYRSSRRCAARPLHAKAYDVCI